ncbi:MAG: endonuclease/exonuclease/phosphatase family protein [Candidatus Obscuribacterales bacterium]|nr:endonuclease/exonuclease/phosphatase family protein [Candidatus Obscuribacterales bacterium]
MSFMALMTLANLLVIAELYLPTDRTHSSALRLKVFQSNVNTRNRQYDRVIAAAKASDADLISFEELDSAWVTALDSGLRKDYPYRIALARDDNFGIAAFSRFPMKAEVLYLELPIVLARVEIPGHPLNFVCVHTLPPMQTASYDTRNQEFADLALLKSKLSGAMIVAGDFNCSSWSPKFTELLKNTGLKDSRQGFGVQASWPVFLGIPLIPIDHFLVSEDLVVLSREVLPDVGSDHYPVKMEVSFKN